MIDRLIVPDELHRNAPPVAVAGYENTGQLLIDLAMKNVGLNSLEQTDVLDVGCGVRFVMTLINRRIPIKSYTGIEVFLPIVDFLKENVEAYDPRFKFTHWNAHNELYNPNGVKLTAQTELPVAGTFDLIWLFSVFTHLAPEDSLNLLLLLRKRIREGGKLFFTTFIDEGLDGFDDRDKDSPLHLAHYGKEYMKSLVEQAGWKIEAFRDADPSGSFIQHHLVCVPA